MTGSNVARRRRRRRRNGGRNGHGQSGGRRGRRLLLLLGPLSVLLVMAGLIGGIAAAFYGINRYNEFVATVVPPEELLAQLPRGGARIYDRNGTLLYEFIDEIGGLRRPVPLSDISPSLIDATVATEDSDFWENNGLNTRGLARAAWENFSPFGALFEGSGGSSITQQLAKNVYIPREERANRSIERKLKEAAIALELTDEYSKEQILEWYLNSISYGGIYVGVEAASEGYFGKTAAELTLAESALLAGIPQRPAEYDPINNRLVALARQSQVLDLMVRREMITPSQADDARNKEIEFRTGRFDIDAAHFVLGRVAREIEQRFGARALYEDGLEVITTLDLELQHEAERILDGWIREFEESSDGHNGAFFALDPLTGQILVYVGSRDYFRDDIEGRNDNIISLNSPGSTLKPFTYLTAFMQGWSTGTGILDTPIEVIDPATGDFFSPRNPGTGYQGVITAEKALGNSLNIPAFKTILFAGVNNVVSVLKEAGFTTLDNPLGYGPALTLGGVDITLEDLTYGYSVFATGGVMRGQQTLAGYDPGERTIDPVALLKVTDADGETRYEFTEPAERRVFASNFTYLVTSILSDGDNQCITFRVCGALGLPGRASAQKTGTSEPFVESRQIGETWAVGYTPLLVAGVWAGNSDNSPMVNIVSTSISWRTWRDFMIFAHEHLELPPQQFERPPGLVERELCWPSGRLPSDLCPQVNRYEGLFAADAIPSDGEELEALVDDWWQLVGIDTRTGLLAVPTTPARLRGRRAAPGPSARGNRRVGGPRRMGRDARPDVAARAGRGLLDGGGAGAHLLARSDRHPERDGDADRTRRLARLPALRDRVGARREPPLLGAHQDLEQGGGERSAGDVEHAPGPERRLHAARGGAGHGARRAALRHPGERRQRRPRRHRRSGAVRHHQRPAGGQRRVWSDQRHRYRAQRRHNRRSRGGGRGDQPAAVDADHAQHAAALQREAGAVGYDAGRRRCVHVARHRPRPDAGERRGHGRGNREERGRLVLTEERERSAQGYWVHGKAAAPESPSLGRSGIATGAVLHTHPPETVGVPPPPQVRMARQWSSGAHPPTLRICGAPPHAPPSGKPSGAIPSDAHGRNCDSRMNGLRPKPRYLESASARRAAALRRWGCGGVSPHESEGGRVGPPGRERLAGTWSVGRR